jgi:hypothetical protein
MKSECDRRRTTSQARKKRNKAPRVSTVTEEELLFVSPLFIIFLFLTSDDVRRFRHVKGLINNLWHIVSFIKKEAAPIIEYATNGFNRTLLSTRHCQWLDSFQNSDSRRSMGSRRMATIRDCHQDGHHIGHHSIHLEE